MWLRSPGWEFDSLSALWREVSSGAFTANDGSNTVDNAGRNGASILLEGHLEAGESHTYPIVIAWHFPNCYLREGGVAQAQNASVIEAQPGCRTVPADAPPPWHPYYSTLWKDAREVAAYVEQNFTSLRTRTVQFKNAVFSSTFPPYVLDAVSANLAIREIANDPARGERQRMGLGRLLPGCGMLPRIVHARVELCAGAAAFVSGARANAARS